MATPDDDGLVRTVRDAVAADIPSAYEDLALSQAAEAWMSAVFACNAYIDAQAPWALRKTDPARMETVLATLYICIAQLAVAISPIIPASAAKLLDQMGIAPRIARHLRRSVATGIRHWPRVDFAWTSRGLFPRLEMPAAKRQPDVRSIPTAT